MDESRGEDVEEPEVELTKLEEVEVIGRKADSKSKDKESTVSHRFGGSRQKKQKKKLSMREPVGRRQAKVKYEKDWSTEEDVERNTIWQV